MSRDKFWVWTIRAWLGLALIVLAFWAIVFYVAYHFLSKYW